MRGNGGLFFCMLVLRIILEEGNRILRSKEEVSVEKGGSYGGTLMTL